MTEKLKVMSFKFQGKSYDYKSAQIFKIKDQIKEENTFQPQICPMSREIVGTRYQPGQYMRGKNVRRSLGYPGKPNVSKFTHLHDQEARSQNKKLQWVKERVLFRSTKKSAARTAANIADLDSRDASLLNFAMQNAYREQWGQGMLHS